MFGFSLWVTVVSLCQRLIFSVMPSILAITTNPTKVALSGLASSLEGYVYTVAAVCFAAYAALSWRFSMNAYEKALIGDMFKGLQTRLSKK